MISHAARAALCAGLLAVFCADDLAIGSTIQWQTPSGSTIGGEAVNALATFVTSPDTVTVTIQNLQVDPNSPKAVVYGVLFSLTSGQTTGTISSTTGIERTIVSGGSYTDTGIVDVIDWALVSAAPSLNLNRLDAPGQKKHGVIGPPNSLTNLYNDAGGALSGTSHNPFWANSAVFVLNVPGVTVDSSVSAATFAFNTTSGDNIIGVQVPEPAAIALVLCGLVGLVVERQARRTFAR